MPGVRPPEPTVTNPAFEFRPRRGGSSIRPSWPISLRLVAFAVIVVLMRFGYVARVQWWVWLTVFVSIVVVNLQIDRLYRARPNWFTLNLRVVSQVAAVTITIYLTGWGPVLWAAYIFIALENMSRAGSRVWKASVICSIIGMAVGQFCLSQGWLPSELKTSEAASLTVMGAFVLFFVIRMAAVIMEQNETAMAQKEEAETTLRLSEDRFRSLIQNSSDVTMILGEQGVFRYVSPAIKDLLHYEPDELVGRLATDFVHPEDLDTVLKMLNAEEFLVESGQATLEFRMLRRDGTTRDVEAVVSNQTDRASVAGYVSNIRDVTERKKFEALLAFRALHDPLTGLANRQLILDRAQQMLVRARRSGVPVAALFIDLDNFKDSNDSLGHGAGDKLLQMVAGRLLGILRSGDTVGRLGGDEFVILAEGVSFARGPEMIAERVHEVLKPAFHLPGIDNMSITVSASIGIAVGDRPSAEDLLRDADIALYRAKGAGRDQSVLFEHSMQSAAKERLSLKSDLETALADNEFSLLYHPIFDLDGIEIQGVEALLRWEHPGRGTITPDVFIPVLEERGLILDVGRWVLNESCREAAAWHRRGHRRQHFGQRLHAPARVRPARRGRAGGIDHQRARSLHAHSGGDRVHPDAGLRRHRGPAQPAEAAGRQGGHRRLRHRLLVAGLPAPVPGGRVEDRPLLRVGHEPLARRSGADPHAHRARPHPRAGDAGRGDRDPRAARRAAGRGVQPRAGVPLLRPGRPRWRWPTCSRSPTPASRSHPWTRPARWAAWRRAPWRPGRHGDAPRRAAGRAAARGAERLTGPAKGSVNGTGSGERVSPRGGGPRRRRARAPGS